MMIAAACGLLLVGVGVYVFWMHGDAETGEVKTRLAYLRERKDVVYENLRDLNFEYKAGKLPDADFMALRDSMEQEAAGIMAEMETLEHEAAPA
ncbi:MAG: hypothetical protein JO041_10830 [Acidobacteria bacterium]|nr:hypothetical protein [Acidobacteriota bacterium]